MSRALVLGGGGLAGMAWEIGLLAGLRAADVDLALADVVIGTSAGSVVGALLRTPSVDLAQRAAAQLDPDSARAELTVDLDLDLLVTTFTEAVSGARDLAAALTRIGAMALATPTVSEEARRAAVAARLPTPDWPARPLTVTAVDAETGELRTFDRTSGVALVDAVTASCAVPGVWPPATIGGRRYIDGGTGSATNATLALGHRRVLVVAPTTTPARGPFAGIEDETQTLSEAASRVLVITADEEARAAFGANPLDPATRPASALAGRRQADTVAATVRAFWREDAD
jgi:NTE family protein